MGAFRGKNAKILTMVVAIAVLVVFAYITISNKKEEKAIQEAQKESLSKVEKVIMKNLDDSYPASVHEVVKYYCKVLQCMFSGEVSDKEIDKLIDKERALFDEELLEENEYSEFVKGRYAEIKQYKKEKSTLVKYVIGENDDVKYWQNDNKEMASIEAQIYMSGDKYQNFQQTYILRKDKDGKWKILAWENIEESKK